MSNRNLMYRLDKLRYRFLPQIQYNTPEESEESEESEEYEEETDEKSETPPEDFISTQLRISIEHELLSIRKNATVQLSLYFKRNKDRINDLIDEDKDQLMIFVEERYYKKKIK